MTIWQVDFYKRPLKDEQGQILWELLICNPEANFIYSRFCSQAQANVEWLVTQLQQAANGSLPELIQVFRPQSFSLINLAAQQLNLKVEATRHTPALKAELVKRASEYHVTGDIYNPLKLDKSVPQPIPETILGQEWRFASLPAEELIEVFSDRPIPIRNMPEYLYPLNLGIASNLPIPGVIIYAGKKSMQLAQWLKESNPVSLNYVVTEIGQAGGLVLEAGLTDRWILATFADSEIAKSAQIYTQRKQAAKGLHFLLVQPDDSGMTYSGFWLLGTED